MHIFSTFTIPAAPEEVFVTASLGAEPAGGDDCAVRYEMDLARWGKLGRMIEGLG